MDSVYLTAPALSRLSLLRIMGRYSATVLALTLMIVIAFVSAAERDEFWRTTVVYQVYVRSFKDSDGDGIGDINGIIEKLPYFHMLGVGAILLSPIYRSPMVDQGYDVSDFLAVDPLYGGNQAFDKLIWKAKERNLKVLLDFIPNHSSDQHRWFNLSVQKTEPYTHYYVWRDGRAKPKGSSQPKPPNNWLSRYGGSAWEWNSERRQYYLHTYSAHQPDLNFRIRRVELEIQKALEYWLSKGVDGFRMIGVANLYESDEFLDEPVASRQEYSLSNYDSLAHLFTTDLNETFDLVHNWRQYLDTFSIGSQSRLLIVDVKSDFRHILLYYGDSYDPGALPANPLFTKYLGKYSSALDYGYSIAKWHDYMDEGRWANWMLGNPDVSRIASRAGSKRVDFLNILCLLLPGMAFTYYGEELGMLDTILEQDQSKDPWLRAGEGSSSRDAARAPFQWDSSTSAGFSTNSKPWLPVHPLYRYDNLYNQQRDKRSHYSTYWRLVAMRQEPAIAKGSMVLTTHSDTVLSFARKYKDHDTFVVVINFGSYTENINLTNYQMTQTLLVHTASKNFRLKLGESVSPDNVELDPESAVILTTGMVKEYKYIGAGPSVQLSSAVLLALGVTLPVCYSFYN